MRLINNYSIKKTNLISLITRLTNFFVVVSASSSLRLYSVTLSLPIHTIDFTDPTDPTDTARHHKMDELVERMLELHKKLAEKSGDEGIKRAIEETDNEIDTLVYELYELTEEEIKIVEEAVK